MFHRSRNLIIGLTTFNHEFLRLSVSGLRRFSKKITLVIHNDNPCVRLTRRMVRKLGFRGRLHIINSKDNMGLFYSRVAILNYIQDNKISGEWFMFANDDDVVLNTNIPDVAEQNFAIIGNSVVIKSRLLDVLRIMCDADNCVVDGIDVVLRAPSIGFAGTFVRTNFVLEYGRFLSSVCQQIMPLISDIPFAIPTDLIMWNGFIEYMRITHAGNTPIYMNQTNYLMTKLNNTRYASADQNSALINRVVSAVAAALRGDE